MKRQSFPKNKRLLSNEQFRAVLERGRRSSNGLLTLYAAPNDCGHARLGISVGKSFGGAVVRNRLKRLLREVFRQNQQQIPAGFDYVVMIPSRKTEHRRPKTEDRNRTSDLRLLAFERVRASFLALAKTEDRTQKSDFGLPTSDI